MYEPAELSPSSSTSSVSFKGKIPLSISTFEAMIDGFDYVDKTLAIKDFIERPGTHLLLRPRRSGKSTLLTMLRSFFELDETTRGAREERLVANKLKIFTEPNHQQYRKEFAKYPVLYLDFSKIAPGSSFDHTFNPFKKTVSVEFRRLSKVHNFSLVHPSDQTEIAQIRDGLYNANNAARYLKSLTRMLHALTGRRVMVFVDEYDHPISTAVGNEGLLREVEKFFRKVYTRLLKGNEHVERALLAGILRMVKSGFLSGMNNVVEYPLHSDEVAYCHSCMFTTEEVAQLYKHYMDIKSDLTITLETITKWYGGYQSAGQMLYNPWSVWRCLDTGKLCCHWEKTGSDYILQEFLRNGSPSFQAIFTILLSSEQPPSLVEFDDGFPYNVAVKHGTKRKRDEESDALLKDYDGFLFGLLLYSGYLTVVPYSITKKCGNLIIPNQEIRETWETWLSKFAKNHTDSKAAQTLARDIHIAALRSNVTEFHKLLERALSHISYLTLCPKEAIYQVFLFSMFKFGMEQDEWEFKMELEAGDGRADIIASGKATGIIYELKRLKTATEMEMKKKAGEALSQVENKRYYDGFHSGVLEASVYGICFCKKKCQVVRAHYQRRDDFSWHRNDAPDDIIIG